MSKRLSRAQREQIIINYLNHKETPGYEVKENSNGKFIVRAIKEKELEQSEKELEQSKLRDLVEEEEVNEKEFERSEIRGNETIPTNAKQFERSERNFERSEIDLPRNKQDARELLRQLTQLLDEKEDETMFERREEESQQQQGQYIEKRYNPGPQSWRRKKLVL